MSAALPTGTVTFLFSDVEGSTRLLAKLGSDAHADVLREHRAAIARACASHDGVVVDSEGDGSFVAFPTAPAALEAALAIQRALADRPLRVRIGVHTGTALVSESAYIGLDVHRAARIASAAHGGQIVLSASTRSLLGPDDLPAGLAVRDLGEHRLKDLACPERLFQLGEDDFPPLRTPSLTNLPVPATPFLGRAREVGEIVALLRRADVRLLSLTGPGGTGKTRLALQAAAEASDEFTGGVWWTPLAPLRDPGLVLTEVARTLGVVPGQGDGLVGALAARLAGERAMLVLDKPRGPRPRTRRPRLGDRPLPAGDAEPERRGSPVRRLLPRGHRERAGRVRPER